ncbi:hypothetical protein AVEN_253850-1 [Araneus ventricosus]|uniref:Uncharacterized protein n=1 Tax=Araneus ventricosus TaxID=182803 RepID=A0A4Y2TU86_ARAVE|nr:hypothetical protein AVEN_253850-1 [Araneus ventricosus]
MNQMKNIADNFYNPSSTPDAISQAGEKMFLVIYKALANGHNLNNYRYAAFDKSSTKIKSDLSSTKGAALQHLFSNVFLFVASAMYLCPSRRRGGVRI